MRIFWSAHFVKRWVTDNDKGQGGLLGDMVRSASPAGSPVVIAGLVLLGLRLNTLHAPTLDNGELDRQFLGFLTAGTVLLGSTM